MIERRNHELISMSINSLAVLAEAEAELYLLLIDGGRFIISKLRDGHYLCMYLSISCPESKTALPLNPIHVLKYISYKLLFIHYGQLEL
jgi:hypothetical protein